MKRSRNGEPKSGTEDEASKTTNAAADDKNINNHTKNEKKARLNDDSPPTIYFGISFKYDMAKYVGVPKGSLASSLYTQVDLLWPGLAPKPDPLTENIVQQAILVHGTTNFIIDRNDTTTTLVDDLVHQSGWKLQRVADVSTENILRNAVDQGDTKLVDQCLASGKWDAHAPSDALCWAACCGDIKMIQHLVKKHSVDVNQKDRFGRNPLTESIMSRQGVLPAQTLIKAGATLEPMADAAKDGRGFVQVKDAIDDGLKKLKEQRTLLRRMRQLVTRAQENEETE